MKLECCVARHVPCIFELQFEDVNVNLDFDKSTFFYFDVYGDTVGNGVVKYGNAWYFTSQYEDYSWHVHLWDCLALDKDVIWY